MTEATKNPTKPPETKHARKLMIWGLGASAAYIIGMAIYAWFVRDLMWQMKPADLATFLSGVFAPLAFLWLVLGFKQQGDELQNSARALWLQGEELRNSVEQQRQLVEVSRLQLDAERNTRFVADLEAEAASQPQLHVTRVSWNPIGPNQHSGSLMITIQSAGPISSQNDMFIDGVLASTAAILGAGGVIEGAHDFHFVGSWQTITIQLAYTDLRGGRRGQAFEVELVDGEVSPANKVPGVVKLDQEMIDSGPPTE